MKVSALYRPDVMFARAGEDLAVAAGRMEFHEVGALAVLDDGGLVGIVTERDLARAAADGRDPCATGVREYMTHRPVTISPGDSVSRAAALMLDLGARHLPVVEGGEVVGMVSARDLLALEAWTELEVRR